MAIESEKKYFSTEFSENISAAEKLTLLNSCEKRKSSWYITEREFGPILAGLRKQPPEKSAEKGLINESSGKYVWLLRYDKNGTGCRVAYKTNPGKTPWRYIFNSSLPVREARNYLFFEELGIPVAPVIAAGDERKNFILKESFIVSGFLEDTRDGRTFMRNGPLRENREKRQLFCRMQLELLAKLHHADFFHKAFHPRNLLWRIVDGKMEVFWIDVARCRKVSSFRMPRAILWDLHTFFHDMRLNRRETEELAAHYAASAPGKYLRGGAKELFDDLLHFRRRFFTQRKSSLFSEEDE